MYLHIDLTGTYDELIKNDIEFNYSLKMVSCEIDISSYISPKMSLLIHLVKSYYMKYCMLKISTIQNIDKSKLDELKNKLNNLLTK